jgi:hypothetical protein
MRVSSASNSVLSSDGRQSRRVLRDQGQECTSPKACLRIAFRQGWVQDEDNWLAILAILADRNLITHTYDEVLASQIYARLPGHLRSMQQLLGPCVNRCPEQAGIFRVRCGTREIPVFTGMTVGW